MFGTLIASSTVGAGGAASIDFTSIPQTYTDLILVISSRTNYASSYDFIYLQFNGITTSTYSHRDLEGTGSTVFSNNEATTMMRVGYCPGNTATASVFGNTELVIPNYAGSTAKTVSSNSVSENNAVASEQSILVGRWTGTAAITSIKLLMLGGTLWSQYSTAYLYGTLKGSGGATVA